jgi:hypothetical protein
VKTEVPLLHLNWLTRNQKGQRCIRIPVHICKGDFKVLRGTKSGSWSMHLISVQTLRIQPVSAATHPFLSRMVRATGKRTLTIVQQRIYTIAYCLCIPQQICAHHQLHILTDSRNTLDVLLTPHIGLFSMQKKNHFNPSQYQIC